MSLKAFMYKLLLTGVTSAIVLPLATNARVGQSFGFGVGLGVLLYIVGDWILLNYAGNAVATVAEGVMALFAARYWGAQSATVSVSWGTATVFGVAIALVELYFHRYLNRAETRHDVRHS